MQTELSAPVPAPVTALIDLTPQVEAANPYHQPMPETDYWRWLDATSPADIHALHTRWAYLSSRFGFQRGVHRTSIEALTGLKYIEEQWFRVNRAPALRAQWQTQPSVADAAATPMGSGTR